MSYTFGFSPVGLLLYLLQALPNILWMFSPPKHNVLAKNSSSVPFFNWIEHVFGVLTVVLLVLLVNKDGGSNGILFIGLAILFLAGYYVSWLFYYKGAVNPWLLIIGLAGMPPFYFLCIAIWMKNYIAVISCVIFGAAHIAITCKNYLKP